MPISTFADMKIYDPFLQGGFVETMTQNIDVMNASSQGAITMTTDRKIGHYDLEAFFKNTSDLVTRRDITSTAAAEAKKLEQGEKVDVKLNRKIGPVDVTEDALIKAGFGVNDAKFVLGQQSAVAVTQNMVHSSLLSLSGALAVQSALMLDISAESTPTMHSDALVRSMTKMGDMAGRIVCWVMHSAVFFKLVQQQIGDKLTGISDLVLAGASPVTLNRPVLVTDDPALVVAEGSGSGLHNEYLTMGLVSGACTLHDSEGERIYFQQVTGAENLIWRAQGEYAFNVGMKGLAWDVANGGINPTDTALGTGSNWDKIMASHKDLPGVMLRSK